MFFVFQLAGTAVFAIGLWLRLDPKTKGLFEGPESPYVFYTGKIISVPEQEHYWLSFMQSLSKVAALQYTKYVNICVCL